MWCTDIGTQVQLREAEAIGLALGEEVLRRWHRLGTSQIAGYTRRELVSGIYPSIYPFLRLSFNRCFLRIIVGSSEHFAVCDLHFLQNSNYVLSYIWANDETVQEALNIRNVRLITCQWCSRMMFLSENLYRIEWLRLARKLIRVRSRNGWGATRAWPTTRISTPSSRTTTTSSRPGIELLSTGNVQKSDRFFMLMQVYLPFSRFSNVVIFRLAAGIMTCWFRTWEQRHGSIHSIWPLWIAGSLGSSMVRLPGQFQLLSKLKLSQNIENFYRWWCMQ